MLESLEHSKPGQMSGVDGVRVYDSEDPWRFRRLPGSVLVFPYTDSAPASRAETVANDSRKGDSQWQDR